MEKNDLSIFVDSNFYIALNNPTDSLHKKAVQVSRQLKSENVVVYITNMIFIEVVTVLSQRTNRNFAIDVGRNLLKNDHFIMIDEAFQQKSWEIFQSINKKNMGFIDCSILAVLEQESIPYLLTFDEEDFVPLQKAFKFEVYK